MPKLTEAQKRQVRRRIVGKDPRQYGFEFGLWIRSIIAEMIADRFDVSLTLPSIGRLLTSLDITPQKPLRDMGGSRQPEGKDAPSRSQPRSECRYGLCRRYLAAARAFRSAACIFSVASARNDLGRIIINKYLVKNVRLATFEQSLACFSSSSGIPRSSLKFVGIAPISWQQRNRANHSA